MPNKISCAACDLGASSGRVIRGEFDGERIQLGEVSRFTHEPVEIGGDVYWDFPLLFGKTMEGLGICARESALHSIGIDTWGCDFGLLDKNGRMLSNPFSYRDKANDDAMCRVHNILGDQLLYSRTGVANMALNSVYQLYKHLLRGDLDTTSKMLLLPDLFAYFLTGESTSEYTMATTTQLVSHGEWCSDIISRLGFPADIFMEIKTPGGFRGSVSGNYGVLKGLKLAMIPSHDTACALEAVSGLTEDDVLISCGTWSLLGTVTDKPLINKARFSGAYSNYGAASGTLFIRDIAGMWLLNNCKTKWKAEGKDVSFSDISEMAKSAEPFRAVIDPDDEEFFNTTDMPEAIFRKCSGKPPRTMGETARCIYESLALKYRRSIEELEKASGKKRGIIRIIGGGTKSSMLCQLTADACGRVCVCGPYEATAAGNVISQLIASGEVKRGEVGDLLKASFELHIYEPNNAERWSEFGKVVK